MHSGISLCNANPQDHSQPLPTYQDIPAKHSFHRNPAITARSVLCASRTTRLAMPARQPRGADSKLGRGGGIITAHAAPSPSPSVPFRQRPGCPSTERLAHASATPRTARIHPSHPSHPSSIIAASRTRPPPPRTRPLCARARRVARGGWGVPPNRGSRLGRTPGGPAARAARRPGGPGGQAAQT